MTRERCVFVITVLTGFWETFVVKLLRRLYITKYGHGKPHPAIQSQIHVYGSSSDTTMGNAVFM